MEYSSPLAAMRPQPHAVWAGGKDVPIPRSYHGYQTYGPNSFNFKDLSMQQKPAKKQDYFTLKPMRGSSPTSSLTADLDANFHIDKRYPHSSLGSSRIMLTIVLVLKLRHPEDRFSRLTFSSLEMTLVSVPLSRHGRGQLRRQTCAYLRKVQ